MTRGLYALVLAVALTAFAGCEEPGRLELEFVWEDAPEQDVWMWARVEERADPSAPGRILASVGPELRASGGEVRLPLDGVTNGSNRVVVVEVREGSNPNLRVGWYGLSEAFTMAPGASTKVEVLLALARPVGDQRPAAMTLTFDGVAAETANLEQIERATVAFEASGVERVVLANDPSFSAGAGLVDLALEDLGCAEEEREGASGEAVLWQLCEVPDWDMTTGISSLSDGQQSVFMKLVDAFGYESDLYRANVRLDTTPPLVLTASLSAPFARANQKVQLVVSLTEVLGEDGGSTLRVLPEGPGTPSFEGPTRVEQSTSYVWTTTTGTLDDQQDYTFELVAADALGNSETTTLAAEGGADLALRIDGVAPALDARVPVVPSQALFGDEALGGMGGTLELQLALIERSPPANVADGGDCADGGCPVVLIEGEAVGEVMRAPELDFEPPGGLGAKYWGFRFSYAVDAKDWGPVQQEVSLGVEWADRAGNEAEVDLAPKVVFDFVAPLLVAMEPAPPIAKVGDPLAAIVTASEGLDVPPDVVLRHVDSGTERTMMAVSVEPGSNFYNYLTPVTEEMEGGAWAVLPLLLTDLVGNQATADPMRQVLIDATPPQISNLGVDPLRTDETGTVTATFDVDELPLKGAPTVTLGGRVMDCSLPKPVSPKFTCTWEMGAEGLEIAAGTEQAQIVVVEVEDLAGNRDTASTPLIFDFRDPTASCVLTPAGRPVGLGETARLTVLVDETMDTEGEWPLLTADGEAPAPQSSGFGTTYKWPAFPEGEVGEASWSLAIEDKAHNHVAVACSGTISFDTAPPSIVAGSVTQDGVPLKSGPGYKVGDTATIVFNVSEALPTPPVLRIGQQAADGASSDGLFWVFQHTFSAADTPGVRQVSVTMVDAAGNETQDTTSVSAITLDNTPPELVGLEAAPLAVKAGTTVKLVLTASEELQAAPELVVLEAGGSSLSAVAAGGQQPSISYVYTLLFPAGTPDGTYTLQPFTMLDAVGNEVLDDAHPIVLSVDASVPTISDLAVAPVRLTAGDVLQATFDVAEALVGGALTVTVGGLPLECGEHQATSPNRTCVRPTVGDEIAAGEEEGQIVVVDALDQAGNRDTQSRTVVFDFKPPGASCQATPAARPVGIGEAFRLAVVVSEAMAPGWDGVSVEGFGAATISTSGFSTEATLPVVAEGQLGSFEWQVDLEDVAGNLAPEACAGSGTVDGVRPVIEAGSVLQEDTTFREGETAVFSFTVSEALAQAPEVRIGALEAEGSSADGLSWTFSRTFTATDGSGFKQVTVALQDLAGNQTTDSASVQALTLDLDPPSVVGLEAAPLAVQANTEVKVVLTASETLAGAPALVFEAAGAAALVPVADDAAAQKTAYVYTLQVPAGTADAVYSLAPFQLEDVAGNAVLDSTHTVELTVDASVPTVTGLVVSPARLSETGTLVATFDVAEALPAGGLKVTVGGRTMDCGAFSATSPSYTCTRAMVGDELGAGEEAAQIVLVDAVDSAGNRDAASATAVFDFKDPVATCNLSPAGRPARLGEEVRLVINVDEAQAPGFPLADEGGVAPDSVDSAGLTTTLTLAADEAGVDTSFVWAVALQDVAGNAVDPACTVTVAIDTVKPQVVAASVVASGTSFKAGDTLTLSFDVSEALAGPPTVLVGDQPATLTFGDGESFTFTRTFGAEDTSGTRQIAVALEDVAGNTTNDVSSVGAVTLDVDAPTATCTVSPSGRPVGRGEELRLTINYSEPLAAGFPQVLGAPELQHASTVGFSTTYSYLEADKNVETTLSWTVALEDLAGNSTPVACAGSAEVDTRLPKLVDGTFTVSKRLLRGDETLQVGFTVTEPLSNLPVVSVGTLPMVPLDPGATGPTYAYALGPIELLGLDEGSHALGLALLDEAHNPKVYTSADLGSVTADYSAPQKVGFDVSPAVANDVDGITVVLTANEALSVIPLVTATHATTGDTFQLPAQSTTTGQNSYVYRGAEGNPLPDGLWLFDPVTLVDEAGNAAQRSASAQVLIDTAAPALTDLSVTPATTTADGLVTVTAHAAEAPDDDGLRGTLGGVMMACTYDDAQNPNITCTHDLGAAGPAVAAGTEVNLPITLTVVDEAGNAGVGSATVRVDFRAPAVGAATITYAPAVGNPVAAPTAARVGTTIKGVVVADEPLDTTGGLPTLLLTGPGGGSLSGTATSVSAAGDLVLFNFVVPATDQQGAPLQTGTWTGAIQWTDPYGNADAATHPSLVTSILNDAPTLQIDQALVTAVRSPWGNSTTEDLGDAVVPAGTYLRITPADSLSAASTLPLGAFTLATGETATVVRFWPDADQSVLLGTTLPTDDGWPRTALAAFDTPTVYVTGLDGAGNESAPVGLRNMVWVATPRVPTTGTNPNTLSMRPRAAHPSAAGAFKLPLDDALTAGLDGALGEAAASPVWETPRPGVDWAELLSPFPPFMSQTATFDPARGVLFYWNGPQSSVVEFDPISGWSAPPSTPPAPRPDASGQAAAWDAARGRVVLFGGVLADAGGEFPVLDDLHEWDGQSWSQIVAEDQDWPDPRAQAAMTYDGARRELLLFGGDSAMTSPFGDLWAWDGAIWTCRSVPDWKSGEACTSGASGPGARVGAAMAYDAARERVVLVGGQVGALSLDDVWEWDGESWEEVTPGSGPAPTINGNAFQSMADAPGDGVWLLGSAALWRWTGTAWSQVAPRSTSLLNTTGLESISADPVSGVLYVIAEGLDQVIDNGPGPEDDKILAGERLWTWDGAAWRSHGVSELDASERQAPAVGWDETREEVVLHGGFDGTASNAGAVTWIFDGLGWRQAATTGPSARYGHAMAYDEEREVMVLFGGQTKEPDPAPGEGAPALPDALPAETWLWDGSSWSQPTPPVQPPPMAFHAMAWDPVTKRVLLTGGQDPQVTPVAPDFLGWIVYQDTWAWNGTTWSKLGSESMVSALNRHAMTWATSESGFLIFGGDRTADVTSAGQPSTPFDDLSRWIGGSNAWQSVPKTTPWPHEGIGRAGVMLVDLPLWEKVLMWGGDGGDLEAYTWSAASDWSPQAMSGAVPLIAEDGHALYDPLRERVVMLGVSEAGSPSGLMELDVSSVRQPSIDFAVTGSASGFSAAEVVGMTVRAWCGGQAPPLAAPEDGAALEAFRLGGPTVVPGSWVELGTNTATVADLEAGDPASKLTWSAPDPLAARDFIRARDLALGFRCRSVAFSGAEPARVAADYLEVRLSYEPLTVTCGDGACDGTETTHTCAADCL